MIRFDKRRFQQVLLNVIQNAIKFQKQGKIKVKANLELPELDSESEDDTKWMTLCVSVKDQGIGMTKAQAESVFEAFHPTTADA